MDKNTCKVLNFFNANPSNRYSVGTVAKFFPKLSPKDLLEITDNLHKDGYLRFCGTNLFQSTNKGKTYKSVSRKEWLSKHIVAVLALIVSILAFIESTISLIISFLK